MPTLPVILLAFANEREAGHGGYLRTLSTELREVQKCLWEAEGKGLCEVKVLPNATVADIWDAFSQTEFGERIVMFHYSGHADSYALLLEAAEAAHNQEAGGQGLADFLASQPQLELVFLNACATRGHADELIARGLNGVIATSRAVNDKIATHFSTRFYRSLARGKTLSQAFALAKSEVETLAGDGNNRGMHWEGKTIEAEDLFAWELFVRPGAEAIHDWNLPDEVNNPFFLLPELPARPLADLPEIPYPNLHWYTREDADLFFGRGNEIRDVFIRVTDPAGAPVILLYGASGVGKSSLLDAGLLPRLEQMQEVVYDRRDAQQGLWGTFQGMLGHGDWSEQESQNGRPLTLVLDQAEEVFTRPWEKETNEGEAFAESLADLFRPGNPGPSGKLILGMRKEYLPEWEDLLRNRAIPYSKVFVKPLSENGIIEAIRGIYDQDHLQRHYHLEIEKNLPEEIARELKQNQEDIAIAPTLQILLYNLWQAAKARNSDAPLFSRSLYLSLKQQGLLLNDFLDQQIGALGEKWDEGLILDVLAWHTTPMGTAGQHAQPETAQRYSHIQPEVDSLVAAMQDRYLLHIVNRQDSEWGKTETYSRLAHDTLAPLVIQRFNESDAPGQRAHRILESRLQGVENGQAVQALDDFDLSQVKQGRTAMRRWNTRESELVRSSERASRRRKRVRYGAIGIVAALLVIAGILGIVARSENQKYKTAVGSLDSAQDSLEVLDHTLQEREQTLTSVADSLERKNQLVEERAQEVKALDSQLIQSQSRTQYAERQYRANQAAAEALALLNQNKKYEALRAAASAYRQSPDALSAYSALINAFHYPSPTEVPFEAGTSGNVIDTHPEGWTIEEGFTEVVVKNRGGGVVFRQDVGVFIDQTAFVEGIDSGVYIKDDEGNERILLFDVPSLLEVKEEIRSLIAHRNGNRILTGTATGELGTLALNKPGDMAWGTSRGQRFANLQKLVAHPSGDVYALVTERQILVYPADTNQSSVTILAPEERDNLSASFSPRNSAHILVTQTAGTVQIWNWQQVPAQLIATLRAESGDEKRMLDGTFSPDGQRVLTGDAQGNLQVWRWKNQQLEAVHTLPDAIQRVQFSPSGRWLAMACADGKLYLYPWSQYSGKLDPVKFQALTHRGAVNDLAFSPAKRLELATVSADQYVRLFRFNGQSFQKIWEFHLDGSGQAVTFSTKGDFLVGADSKGIWKPFLLDPKPILHSLTNKQIIP